jgi:hypothetical protein
MPSKGHIDRSTLSFSTSYRPKFVIVNAMFEAKMISEERGELSAESREWSAS